MSDNECPLTSVETIFMVMLQKEEPHEFRGLRIHQHVNSAVLDTEGVDSHTDCHIVVLDIDDIATIQHAIDSGLIPRTSPE